MLKPSFSEDLGSSNIKLTLVLPSSSPGQCWSFPFFITVLTSLCRDPRFAGLEFRRKELLLFSFLDMFRMAQVIFCKKNGSRKILDLSRLPGCAIARTGEASNMSRAEITRDNASLSLAFTQLSGYHNLLLIQFRQILNSSAFWDYKEGPLLQTLSRFCVCQPIESQHESLGFPVQRLGLELPLESKILVQLSLSLNVSNAIVLVERGRFFQRFTSNTSMLIP